MIKNYLLIMILLLIAVSTVSAKELHFLSPPANAEDSTETQIDSLSSENYISDNKLISSVSSPTKTVFRNKTYSDSLEIISKPWPTGALIRSAIIPGWGQLYNRKYIKYVIYSGLELFFVNEARKYWIKMDNNQRNFQNPAGMTSLIGGFRDCSPTDYQFYQADPDYQAKEFYLYEKNRDIRNLNLWLTGLTLFISMFDAYVDAHLY